MIILLSGLALMLILIMLGLVIQMRFAPTLSRSPYFVDQDLSFYQAQQQHIDADVNAGLMSLAKARYHQMQLSRQVLSINVEMGLGHNDQFPWRYLLYQFTFMVLVFSAFYGLWGQYWGIARLHKQALAHQWVRQSLRQMGGMPGLVASLKRRVKSEPNEPRAWYFLGRIEFDQKKYQLAYKYLQRAYRLAPENINYRLTYATASIQTKHPLESPISQWLNTLVQQGGDGVIAARQLLAMDAQYRGDYAKSIENWRELLAVLPPQSSIAKQVVSKIRDELSLQHQSSRSIGLIVNK